MRSLASEVTQNTTPIEWVAHTTTLGVLVGVLPVFASFASIVLLLIKTWETDTIKSLTGRA